MLQLGRFLIDWIGADRITAMIMLVALTCLGAFIAVSLSWPLPYVLGPLSFVALYQIFGGRTPNIAEPRRRVVAILALYLGSSFTPELLASLSQWSLSLTLVVALVPVSLMLGYGLFRFGYGMDHPTAWFSAVPGGLTEMSIFGEAKGGDAQTIASLQTLRVVGMIVMIPLAFSVLLDFDRSNASFDAIKSVHRPASDWLMYLVVVFGFQALGARLPIPAGFFTVPMLGACLLYGLGLIQTPPPVWIIILTQLVLGAGLGQRFDYRPWSYWRQNLQRFWLHMLLILALAVSGAWLIAPLVPASFVPLFLAFAPGGLAEMSLLAVALDQEAVFVTSHHLLRIVTALFVGTWLFSLISWLTASR